MKYEIINSLNQTPKQKTKFNKLINYNSENEKMKWNELK